MRWTSDLLSERQMPHKAPARGFCVSGPEVLCYTLYARLTACICSQRLHSHRHLCWSFAPADFMCRQSLGYKKDAPASFFVVSNQSSPAMLRKKYFENEPRVRPAGRNLASFARRGACRLRERFFAQH